MASQKKQKKNFFAFQHFEYHVLVEHNEKHPQPKFDGTLFMGARDMAVGFVISPIEISVN